MTICRLGLAEHTELALALKLWRTLSMEDDTVPVLSALINISVIAAMMQTVDSGLIWLKQLSKATSESHARTWELFMVSLEAIFRPVMFRLTFASPMMVKSLDKDI